MSRSIARPLAAILAVALSAGGVRAQEPTTPADDDSADTTEVQPFVVVEVSGLLDPIEVSYIRQQLAEAESVNAVAFVLQVNSPGDAVSDDELLELLDDLEATDVPVATWVGQSGAPAWPHSRARVRRGERAPQTRMRRWPRRRPWRARSCRGPWEPWPPA